jgi:hypothetical protein
VIPRRSSLFAATLAVALAGASQGAEQKLPAELLEFLGSVDSEDPQWHDYLAATDVKKLPKPAPVAAGDKNKVPDKPRATP